MKAAIALLFLLATASLHAQSRPDWEDYGFSKPVRMIRAEVERTVGGVRGPRRPQETVAFDEKGNMISNEIYKPDGSLQRKLGWGHEYDADGREIKTTYLNDKGELTNTGVHIYDPQGRRIQTTQINPDGSINHIRSYSYDDKGNITRESHRNENGSPRFLVSRNYDPGGRPTEEVFIDAKGAFTHRNVTTYDDRGNQTGWTLFKKDGTVVQVFRNSFSYDARGNIKEYSSHGSDGTLKTKASFTYEFDDRGNWTKRTAVIERFKETRSQVEIEVTFRQLTYF
jgi:hypothetical protein